MLLKRVWVERVLECVREREREKRELGEKRRKKEVGKRERKSLLL